jgi:hypothetical protein
MSGNNPQRTKKRNLNMGGISLLFALSWIILGSRTMPVGFIPQNIWFWLNTAVGYGGLITLIVLIFRGKVKLYNDTLDDITPKLTKAIEEALDKRLSNILDNDTALALIKAIQELTEELRKKDTIIN